MAFRGDLCRNDARIEDKVRDVGQFLAVARIAVRRIVVAQPKSGESQRRLSGALYHQGQAVILNFEEWAR